MLLIYLGKYVFSLKSKFLLYHEAYYPKKLEKYSQKMLATLRGVEGTHFWQKLKFDIFSKFLQHRVAYDQYNLKLFSAMLGHPEGRGRATPIFDKN